MIVRFNSEQDNLKKLRQDAFNRVCLKCGNPIGTKTGTWSQYAKPDMPADLPKFTFNRWKVANDLIRLDVPKSLCLDCYVGHHFTNTLIILEKYGIK